MVQKKKATASVGRWWRAWDSRNRRAVKLVYFLQAAHKGQRKRAVFRWLWAISQTRSYTKFSTCIFISSGVNVLVCSCRHISCVFFSSFWWFAATAQLKATSEQHWQRTHCGRHVQSQEKKKFTLALWIIDVCFGHVFLVLFSSPHFTGFVVSAVYGGLTWLDT